MLFFICHLSTEMIRSQPYQQIIHVINTNFNRLLFRLLCCKFFQNMTSQIKSLIPKQQFINKKVQRSTNAHPISPIWSVYLSIYLSIYLSPFHSKTWSCGGLRMGKILLLFSAGPNHHPQTNHYVFKLYSPYLLQFYL